MINLTYYCFIFMYVDQAFEQVFNHFGETSAAADIVKTLLDDPDTLKSNLLFYFIYFLKD